MEYQLYLRPVNEQDLELIHSWQLNPIILKAFGLPNNNPNSWADTLSWWRNLGSSLVFVLMVIDKTQSATYWKGRPIGLTWVKNLKEYPEIGGYIGDVDYYKKAIIDMYNITILTLNRLKGLKTAVLKIKREEQQLIGSLSQSGWCIDSEIDGMVHLIYGKVAVQST